MAVVRTTTGCLYPALAGTGRGLLPVVVSGDTTPHLPAPLLHACAELAVDPAFNLHIGDSKHDIDTARRAGCKVYCVPYGWQAKPCVRRVDALVPNLCAALDFAQNDR